MISAVDIAAALNLVFNYPASMSANQHKTSRQNKLAIIAKATLSQANELMIRLNLTHYQKIHKEIFSHKTGFLRA